MEKPNVPDAKMEGIFPAWASALDSGDLTRFLSGIIMNAKLWLMFLDTSNNVVIWNKAAEEISGYSCVEVLGNNAVWKWIYPDSGYRQIITGKIVESIRSRKTLENFETVIRTKNGETKRISWNTRELIDDNGKSAGFIVIGDDITVIAEAKKEIERFAEFQKSVIVNAKLWMTFLDTHNNILIWNKAAEEITGYTSDEVVGKNEIWKWLYPDSGYRKEVTSKIRDIIKNNKSLGKFRNEDPHQETSYTPDIMEYPRASPGKTGPVSDILSSGMTLPRKYLAKKELKESEELFHGIATAASEAIALFDQNGVIWSWILQQRNYLA